MGESVKSASRLEVSVSFGRFENDSLSWEKWSTFSPNKYLEEVGNLSTPGSVAQKKAYFEAHYKKIAAQKAEQSENDKQVESCNQSINESDGRYHVETSAKTETESVSSSGEKSVDVEQETCAAVLEKTTTDVHDVKDEAARSREEVKQDMHVPGLINVTNSEEKNEDAIPDVEDESSAGRKTKEELDDNAVNPESGNEEAVLIEAKTPQKDSKDIVEDIQETKSVTAKSRGAKKEIFKSSALNLVKKVNPTKRERDLGGAKKKVVSPAVKSSPISPAGVSKPALKSTPKSAPQTLKKKVNGSPLPKSKNLTSSESKRTVPTSLHMSLSLGPSNYSSDPATTRKSLIMEQMGDKDIVRRAFKTFLSGSRPSGDEKFTTLKQVPSTASERRLSTSLTPRKEADGARKVSEKTTVQKSQSATKLRPASSGSVQGSGMDRKNAMAVSPAIGSRKDERAEKRKEFLKNLEAKSIARRVGHIAAKSKEDKKAEIKKLGQSLNIKISTPMPSSHRGQGKE